jgi:hypothetical protein
LAAASAITSSITPSRPLALNLEVGVNSLALAIWHKQLQFIGLIERETRRGRDSNLGSTKRLLPNDSSAVLGKKVAHYLEKHYFQPVQ